MTEKALKAHPSIHARTLPQKSAIILSETGERLSYGDLERRSNQAAHLFRRCGLARGNGIAILMENSPRFFEPVWGAQRSGLYLTTLSTKLTAEEAAFIVSDSGARILIASASLQEQAEAIANQLPQLRLFIVYPEQAPSEQRKHDYDQALAAEPAEPIADQSSGSDMLYSSGTTGRPKGVRLPLLDTPFDAASSLAETAASHYGIGPDTVYISPAPLYHAAPLRWTMGVLSLGGTVVVMQRFDPEAALATIEKYRVTAGQWVPTHFVRLLKLPEDLRARHDLSSMKLAIHAAAPCPAHVKRAMLEWWGPILHEYYSSTESFGFTVIGPEEWLRKPGSVGRAINCEVRICGPDGEPIPVGETGDVYFKSDVALSEYHGDPEKTRASRNHHGWATCGDIGHVDDEGYLFLTDRRSFTIISGGVNIYPQEIENVLVSHPAVRDVAVFGVPDAEMGERVIAVVEPMQWSDAGEVLAADIGSFARARLSSVKVPRQIDFIQELPRQPTGKLFKRLLRDDYLKAASAA